MVWDLIRPHGEFPTGWSGPAADESLPRFLCGAENFLFAFRIRRRAPLAACAVSNHEGGPSVPTSSFETARAKERAPPQDEVVTDKRRSTLAELHTSSFWRKHATSPLVLYSSSASHRRTWAGGQGIGVAGPSATRR